MKRKLILFVSAFVIALLGTTIFAYQNSASKRDSECGDCLRNAAEIYHTCKTNNGGSKCRDTFIKMRDHCILYVCRGEDIPPEIEDPK
jgi:hypothetical protein